MNKSCKLILIATFLSATTACIRDSQDDDCLSEVSIPVKIDWSVSGITPGQQSDVDFVHRVSIRFFPKDGSPAFDRYLEKNIFEGNINVPRGLYSVVVYNEAIDDVYWSDGLKFDRTDDYNQFSANIIKASPIPYDFYTPQPEEMFAAAPLKLASWNLDLFEVPRMNDALTKVKLRRLIIPAHVVAEVTNLKSAMRMEAALTGMASKIYMASGERSTAPATHLFTFQSPIWNDETKTDGRVERKLLTFGRLPQPSPYSLNLGVVFVSGERYKPDAPLRYDVTEQVGSSQQDSDIKIQVKLALSKVEGDINIGEWNDEEYIIY